MKHYSKYIFLLLIISAISQLNAYTQDSLSYYLEQAALHNPGVKARYLEYSAALERVPQASSLPDPELSLGVFLKPMEILSGKQVADIKLMQMFPWFGVLRSARDEMSLMANARFEVFRDAKLQVYFDVQRQWNEIYKIRKEINISEKNIEILRTIERLAIVKFKAAGASSGGNGLVELYRIQIESGDLENNIASLSSRLNTVIATFNSYLNRNPSIPVFTPETIAQDTLILSLTAIADSILANNPMLEMIGFEKQSLEAREKMIRGMGYPMIGAGINYSLVNSNPMSASSMNGKDMIMPMVSVTIPVYRKKYDAMKAEVEFEKAASSYNYLSAANSLKNEYYQAVQSYQDAMRRIELFNSQYELASGSLELMLKSFSVSASSLTDVLRVRQQTLDYEFKKTEALTDFNTAVAWLNRLMAGAK